MELTVRRQEDLQVKLRERLRRLLVADHESYLPQLRLTRDFLASDPLVASLLAEAALAEPGLDIDAFIELMKQRQLAWPHTTEGGQTTIVWDLMNRMVDGTVSLRMAFLVTGERNFNDGVRRLTEMIFAPLFDYLGERVGEQSSVLHALERYVRVVEWFDRDSLLADYEQDTSRGEAAYDRHLRRFLFGEGLDMPFSQAHSPSGDSDALSAIHDEDSLVCEIKLFDGESRGKRHVATGVHQAHQYAVDYGKTAAYLVIVNLSGRPLELPTDGHDKAWPPYVDLAGVRVYLVAVRARRLASASKLGRAAPVDISRDDLVDPDIED